MESVFTSVLKYLREVYLGVKSILTSCFTALPYLFNRRSGDLHKEVTEQYPDPVSSRTADDLPSRSRGLLFNDIDRCTGCKACEEICPTKCITVENELGTEASKVWVAVFDIDMSRCMFCGLCVEVCIPQSLVHTKEYEGAAYYPRDLVISFGRGRITPEQRTKWAAIRQAKEAEETL
ncbi:4Fe-4S binding protein [bacterium]|jgi:formate hydrogenlyase subunit 6/NADH:ubiquinone oxidoreductase subunit I|nr:4Fe-4S binding protein [bacterium]